VDPLTITVHTDVDQRSAEWHHSYRAGRVGGSEAKIVVSGKTGNETAAKRDLRTIKALEQCGIQQPVQSYMSADMQRGVEREAGARAGFEFLTGCMVDEVGYVSCNSISAGCSPDGLIGEMLDEKISGVLEIKCPRPANHWKSIRLGAKGLAGIPTIHHPQILHTLAITGRECLAFCSYAPEMGIELELYIRYVFACDLDVKEEINKYMDALTQFLAEIDKEAEEIKLAIKGINSPPVQPQKEKICLT
jgi:hypothetical protein